MALDVLDDDLVVGDKIHWFDLKHYVTGARLVRGWASCRTKRKS
ncbi:Uncharacterised protein [Chromobacterium violaceum]|uniref:Uncharacterized protein n=1 Tax=Chromobacterium violaceum TaxID=536 RepID=A0A3S4HRP5_CHRVL|nr:Uncharacterised protein [Chromobacterium violaceum]